MSFVVAMLAAHCSTPKHATSSDPHVQPVIHPNYISEELDLAILVDSMKFVRKLTSTEEWKDVGEKEIFPGPEVDTDDKLRGRTVCYRKHFSAVTD